MQVSLVGMSSRSSVWADVTRKLGSAGGHPYRYPLSVDEPLVRQPVLPQIDTETARKLSEQILRLQYRRLVIGLTPLPYLLDTKFSQALEKFGDLLFVLARQPGGFPSFLKYLANGGSHSANSHRRVRGVSVMQNFPGYDHVACYRVSYVVPGISVVGESLIEPIDQGIVVRRVDQCCRIHPGNIKGPHRIGNSWVRMEREVAK